MRLIYNNTMIALTALTVAACAGKKESAATGTTREELTFPVGERIESAAFTTKTSTATATSCSRR